MSAQAAERSEYDGVVLLTGFGPFGQVLENASWEVVRTLVEKQPDISIEGRRYALRAPSAPVHVSYSVIDAAASDGNHYYADVERPPCLLIHVGVGRQGSVYLETQAHNEGYVMPDCDGELHHASGVCVLGSAPQLQTHLDVQAAVAEVSGASEVSVVASSNCGRYLCEYIYYKSLEFASARRVAASGQLAAAPDVLFVHVPPFGCPYSQEALVQVLGQVVRCCLVQLQQRVASVVELASLMGDVSCEDAELMFFVHGSMAAAVDKYVESPENALATARAMLGHEQPLAPQDDAFAQGIFSLMNMGIKDEAAAREALIAANGDVQAAALALAA